MTPLLDEFFPAFDARERHVVRISAQPEAVYAALRTADLSRSIVTKTLLTIRALPAWLAAAAAGRPRPARRSGAVTLAAFERLGFVVLAERPPVEMLIALQGRFWTLDGALESLDEATARQPVPPGRARAGWNFALTPEPRGTTVLSTETRILCADAATRRRFLRYWRVIRPGSGLIRRAMLASVKRAAEAEERPARV